MTLRPHQRRILVVDDNPDNRYMLVQFLAKQHHVTEAGDGREALQLMQNQVFDLLITDLEMPFPGEKMIECLRLQSLAPEIPIIIVSGHHRISQLAQKLKVFGFLQKPFTQDEIREMMVRFMETVA